MIDVGSITEVELLKGDRLLLTCPHKLTDEEKEATIKAINGWLNRTVNLLILDEGMTLSVVRDEDDA